MYAMEIFRLIIVVCALTTNHASNCVCTNWTCNGHTSDSTKFHHCVRNSSLWEGPRHCTICATCSTNNSSTSCTCDTQSNCSHPLNTSFFWWTTALSCGGILLLLFTCAILAYIFKSRREDHETELANIIQLHRHQSHDHSEFEDYQTEAYADESDTYSEPESSTKDAYHLQTPLNIVINSQEVIQTIPPYTLLFKDKQWDDIDRDTKYLVVGFISKLTTRLALTLDRKYIINVIHLVIICLYDNSVCFDTFSSDKDFVMSSNGFYYGIHEWSVEVTHTGLRAQEIGMVGKLDATVNVGSRRLSGEDVSICDLSQFGARTVYGRDKNSFYYGSYNDNDFERCKVYLNKYHKYDRWKEGDQIKIRLDIKQQSVQFYLNGKKMRKRIKIQKNKKYFPIISHYGRFRCRIVDYK